MKLKREHEYDVYLEEGEEDGSVELYINEETVLIIYKSGEVELFKEMLEELGFDVCKF